MNRIYAVILLLGMVWACEESLHAPEAPEQVLIVEDELVELSREPGKLSVDFMSTDPWTAVCDASWVNVVDGHGDGSSEKSSMTVSYDPNYARVERTASIFVMSGDLADTLDLVQAPPHDATISDFFARVHKENYAYQYICAHRANTYEGMYKTMDCPENSVPAVERCIAKGLDMVEIDVRMTKDGQLVCCHDEGISNVTNGKGNIADMTLDEIRAFDAKVRVKGLVVKGVKMATLGEILDVCKDRIWVNLDLSKERTEQVVAKVVEEVRMHGMEHQVTCYIGSSGPYAMKYYDSCNDLSIHLYIGGMGDVASKISSVRTVPLLQIGAGTWNAGSHTLPDEIHAAGYCGLSNLLDYDSKTVNGDLSYLTFFTDARLDFIQTDYGDHQAVQNFLKSKNLR